jgi:hypothetical protein
VKVLCRNACLGAQLPVNSTEAEAPEYIFHDCGRAIEIKHRSHLKDISQLPGIDSAAIDEAQDGPKAICEQLHREWELCLDALAGTIKGADGCDKLYQPNLEIVRAAMAHTVHCKNHPIDHGAINQIFQTTDGENIFKPFSNVGMGKILFRALIHSEIAISPTALLRNALFTYAISEKVCREMGIPPDKNPFLRPTLCNDGEGVLGTSYPYVREAHYFDDPPPDALDSTEKIDRFYAELAFIAIVGTITAQIDMHEKNVLWGKGQDGEWHLHVVDYDLIKIPLPLDDRVFGISTPIINNFGMVGWPFRNGIHDCAAARLFDFYRQKIAMATGVSDSPQTPFEKLLSSPPQAERRRSAAMYNRPPDVVKNGDKFVRYLQKWRNAATPSRPLAKTLNCAELTSTGLEFIETLCAMFPNPPRDGRRRRTGINGSKLFMGATLCNLCSKAGFLKGNELPVQIYDPAGILKPGDGPATSIDGGTEQFCSRGHIDTRDPILQDLVVVDSDFNGMPTQISNLPPKFCAETGFYRQSASGENCRDRDFISMEMEFRGLRVNLFRGRIFATAHVHFGTMANGEMRAKDVSETLAAFNVLRQSDAWRQLNDLLADDAVAFVEIYQSGSATVDVYGLSSIENFEGAPSQLRQLQPLGGGTVEDLKDVDQWREALAVEKVAEEVA